ncbi:MAG: DUF1553 domain-containing protein [Saprospiraceae bacterium]|nr:DUF1553 domain-containing protein [Saprospiraceae bacterium]
MSETFRRDVRKAMKVINWIQTIYFFHRRRLDAEDIRDGILSVSGWIDTLMYGEPVALYITPFMQGRGRPNKSGPLDGEGRRSIYQEVRRNFLELMMLTFDRPVPFTTFGNRNISNVPAQSLILLNDPFVIQQAEEMACWIIDSDLNFEERVETIYYRAFARKPSTSEIDQAKSFLFSLAQMHKVPDKDILLDLKVWKDYCHSIFNIKEFIYLI